MSKLILFSLCVLSVVSGGHAPVRGRSRQLTAMWGASQQPVPAHLQAFLKQQRLHHLFEEFYQDDQQRWYIVTQMFGQSEDEPPKMQAVACPVLDRATFRRLGSYWLDCHGVYYPALTNFTSRVVKLDQADAASFRSLGFEHLAVDCCRVYRVGALVPKLAAATLRVYTPGGQRNTDWDFNNTAYLVSGQYGVNEEGRALSHAQVRTLKLPSGYKLAYPLPKRKQ